MLILRSSLPLSAWLLDLEQDAAMAKNVTVTGGAGDGQTKFAIWQIDLDSK